MTLLQILETARENGVIVDGKANCPGVFVLRKFGMVEIEALEVCGHASLIMDPNGRYPVQVSTEAWNNIVFPPKSTHHNVHTKQHIPGS